LTHPYFPLGGRARGGLLTGMVCAVLIGVRKVAGPVLERTLPKQRNSSRHPSVCQGMAAEIFA
jgi:hypothetical protein